MKKKMIVAFAALATIAAFAPAASAEVVGRDNLDACADTDLSHYVNNFGTCEGGSWVSVRIGATCVNTYADDFRC